MSDDLAAVGIRDRTRINLDARHEVMFWTKKLGIDEKTLKEVVKAAGPTVGAIRQHLLSHPRMPGS